MLFRLRQDTLEWFKNIREQKPFETMFDVYYFCAMVGLAAGRKSSPSERCSDCNDFVDNFPKTYRSYQRIVIGLLLRAELSLFGISVSERDEVRKFLLEIVDPVTPTNLTDKGMEKLNQYASGGFDHLAERLESKPYTVEEFLTTYVKILREAVAEGKIWGEVKELVPS